MSGMEWAGREAREEERLRRFGEGACCVVCGLSERRVLRKASKALIEFHHLAGQANHPTLGIFLCLNHHRILTEQMRDAGVPLGRDEERVFLERLQAFIVGVGLALVMIGNAMIDFAKQLGREISRLDHDTPGWRGLPGPT